MDGLSETNRSSELSSTEFDDSQVLIGWVRFVYIPTKRLVIDRAEGVKIRVGDRVELRSSNSNFEGFGIISHSMTEEYLIVETNDIGDIKEGDEVYSLEKLSPQNRGIRNVEKEEN